MLCLSRTSFRLALAAGLGLAALASGPAPAPAAAPPEKALPASTLFFAKVADAAKFREALGRSQMGQLWNDPAMKPLRDDIAAKLDERAKGLRESLGLSVGDLLRLPQGPIALAVLGRDDPKVPVALLLTADAGKNADRMDEVLKKATEAAEKKNAKVSTETFKDLTLHVLRPADEGKKEEPPVAWTRQATAYHIATDLDALKDLIAHADGRDDALAAAEGFAQVRGKVGEDAQASWYLDIAQLLKLVSKLGNAGGGGNPQQVEAMLQVMGINGLKAVGGGIAFNAGGYDSRSRLFFYAPAPAQGILRVFKLPKVDLRPEPWAPASAVSYQSISWDLDNAYTALNDLANMLQPGLLDALQQQLAGPNGGEPLNFQKDIFGPLGDRITILSDFKKAPKAEPKADPDDDQRTLFAVALEDANAFRNTLNKLMALAQLSPKKREFQGTTIYDFDLKLPNPGGAQAKAPMKGSLSLAVAKDHCFVSTEPTLLEQVLRSGGPRLADAPEFQAVAKEIPAQTSTFSYARPEEGIRQLYEMVKSGKLQEALDKAGQAQNAEVPKLSEIIDKDKLPEFSVISKYLSASGGYGQSGEEGFLSTSFTLLKANP